jgi:hypothetical protein
MMMEIRAPRDRWTCRDQKIPALFPDSRRAPDFGFSGLVAVLGASPERSRRDAARLLPEREIDLVMNLCGPAVPQTVRGPTGKPVEQTGDLAEAVHARRDRAGFSSETGGCAATEGVGYFSEGGLTRHGWT